MIQYHTQYLLRLAGAIGTLESGTFKNVAYSQCVLIDDEDEFKAGLSDQVFHRVRIGISAPRTRSDIKNGLAKIRRFLDEADAGYDSFG